MRFSVVRATTWLKLRGLRVPNATMSQPLKPCGMCVRVVCACYRILLGSYSRIPTINCPLQATQPKQAPAFDSKLVGKRLEVCWPYKHEDQTTKIWASGTVVRVADGLTDKRSKQGKKILPAGALLWAWEADAEYEVRPPVLARVLRARMLCVVRSCACLCLSHTSHIPIHILRVQEPHLVLGLVSRPS